MNLLAQDLRCLHGNGLSLWLNPSDNQGARFCLAAVEAGQAWEP
jgi:hypothetical protein